MNDTSEISQNPPATTDGSNCGVLYKDAAAALNAVNVHYNHWTEKLTDTSFQLSLAVIGSNWAVFGSVDKILKNACAQWSIVVVLIGLGVNLIGTKFMGEMLRDRILYAEGNNKAWQQEFIESRGCSDPWPFTKSIDSLGRFLRECKTWVPILGGVLFILALVMY